jgi:hypothetical protein
MLRSYGFQLLADREIAAREAIGREPTLSISQLRQNNRKD